MKFKNLLIQIGIAMRSRILKYHYDNEYCELDGEKCSHCRKCDHLPAPPKASNWLNKLLIACIIICIIIFIIHPLITGAYHQQNIQSQQSPQSSKKAIDNSDTLEAKVDNYNKNMPDNERNYRNNSRIWESFCNFATTV